MPSDPTIPAPPTPAPGRALAASAWPHHPVLVRLFWLRWATVAGELLVLAGARLWLDIALPLAPLLGLIALQLVINVATLARMRAARPASQGELFLQLLLDVALLSALLYFSGGATNPFVSFYLPTLAAAAATLAWPYAGALTLCALAGYSALANLYQPLHIHDHDQAMSWHLAGMWINFSISALLITWFVTRIAATVRERDALLAAAREQHLQGQRILALGTQAAGAAHALNTPLSTVAVIAGELRRDMAGNPALALYEEDILVVEQQIAVCKQALESMRLDADAQARSAHPVPLGAWLRELLDGWRLRHPGVVLVRDIGADGMGPAASVDTVELGQILFNLLDNAAAALAASDKPGELTVSLAAAGASRAVIRVADNGCGIEAGLLARLGHGPVPSRSGGRGIGLMLAHATVRQLGASLRLQSVPGEGSVAELEFALVRP